MAKVLSLLCSLLLVVSLYHHVTAQPQRKQKPSPPFAGFGAGSPSPSGSHVRLKGLCRDGWKEGTSQDIYGNEIPICIKINNEAQTWLEAQNTCRRDFGFLLKLESPIRVDGNDLMSLVLSKGITNIWTGAHTDNSHLVWDDLVPNQLKPNNFNQSDRKSWSWSKENPNKLSEYCGKLSIDEEEKDRKKKRKKRNILSFDTSESDSNDKLFGSSESLFGQSSESSGSSMESYPQASAFQELLARAQFNDRLAALPAAALGVQSAHQLPGSGLSGDNLQKGGLATVSPYFQTTSQSDGDSDKEVPKHNSHDLLKNAENLGFQKNSNLYTMNPQVSGAFNQGVFNQGQFFNQPNPTVAASLVGSVREHAEKLGIGGALQAPSPTEILETLTEQFNDGGMQNSENSNQDVMDMLTALKQMNVDNNPDKKSHDILNVVSPGMLHVNPTAQIIVNPELRTQDINPFNSNSPVMNQNMYRPTTVSPFFNAFLGQENQKNDDSSSISDGIKDLLKDVANKESSQKELSDSAKDLLQSIQPTVSSHSEQLEALNDKLNDVKDAVLKAPSNNLFNGNFQDNAKTDDSDNHKLPVTDALSNLNNALTDQQKDVLSSDKDESDDQKKSDNASLVVGNNDKLTEFSSGDSENGLNLDNNYMKIFQKESLTDKTSDDQTENLKEVISEIPFKEKAPEVELNDSGVSNSNSDDIVSSLDDIEKKDTLPIKDSIDPSKPSLDVVTEEDDSKDKTILPMLPIVDKPTIPESVSDFKSVFVDGDLQSKTGEDDLKASTTLITSGKSEDDTLETVEEMLEKSSDNTPKVSLPEKEDINEEMIDNLNKYLEMTKPKTEPEVSDDTVSINNPGDSMPPTVNQIIIPDDVETKEIESQTEMEFTDDLNEEHKSIGPNNNTSITEPLGVINDIIEDETPNFSINERNKVNLSDVISDKLDDESPEELINEKDKTSSIIPSLDTENISDLSDAEPHATDERPSFVDHSEETVEVLLRNVKQNITDADDDETESNDGLINKEKEHIMPEKSSDISTDNVEEENEVEPTIEVLNNDDLDENVISAKNTNFDNLDDGLEPISNNETKQMDVSDVLEKYGYLLENNREYSEQSSDAITEDADENNETKNSVLENYRNLMGMNSEETEQIDDVITGREDADDTVESIVEQNKEGGSETLDKPDMPDDTNKTDNKENDDLKEKIEEIMDDKADKIVDLPLDETSLDDSFDDLPTLAEAVLPESEKTAILPTVGSQEMELSTCRQKLPSVCFSYQMEVMSKVSSCEDGWYGHVLHNRCYRIIITRESYREAAAQCQAMGADIVRADSDFERLFTLLAVAFDGQLFRGTKFWKHSPKVESNSCDFYDETGIKESDSCIKPLNTICAKPARQLEILANDNLMTSETKVFMMANRDVVLPCGLTRNTHELPVMWFKDGLLVSTITSDDSGDPSLLLNQDLINQIRLKTNRDMSMAALQGRYWCEVWDTTEAVNTPIRKRSPAFDVRFSDVISFHGSMALDQFTYKDEALFNLMDQTFPRLAAIEMDLKKIFRDVLPVLRGTLDYVSGVYTHVDKVRSSPRVLEYHTYISLTTNYTVADEVDVYNRLKGLLRAVLGNVPYMSTLPGKTPVTSFRTMALQSTILCPAAELRTNIIQTLVGRVFKFPNTLLGEKTNSNETCGPTDLRPAGSANCLGDFYTGAYWGDVQVNDCTPLPVQDVEEDDEEEIIEEPIDNFNQEVWGKTPQTDTLTKMAQTPVDESNVENITGTVAKITSDALAFTPTDINKIADVLEHTTSVEKVTEEVGKNVIKTVDKLMTMSENEVEVANIETKAANRIIKSLETCAEKVDLTEKDNFRLVTDNIALEVWMLKDDSRPVIGLAAHSDETMPKKTFKVENIATVFNKSQLFDANVDAAIELPNEAFAPKVKGQPARNKLTMMVFRKSKLFEMAARSSDGKALNMDKNAISQLNSYVISASIAGKRLTNLKDKVRTIFKPLKEDGSNQNCVFWDFNLNDNKGGWSSEGCIYDGRINGREVCLCNHLTNFAVLLDFYGQENPIHRDHELSLSIITIIGLSFSILGLALTIVSFVFFKKLRQGRAQQTMFNLAVALLCAMLVFLIGIKQTHHYWWCLSSAVLLHYFILASFMWMLMEAILQYLTFVKILGTYITRFTLKTVLPAWGLPLVPVIIILSLDYTLYKGGPNYCWMSLPAFYYGFAIPISCIIITNVIIFIITIISISRRGKGLRSNQKKKKAAMTNLQAAITSFVLLGLSWLFGYLAVADARLPFQYIFTILNSLQGFFIFILFVVRKKKVREQWYIICCKDLDREKVGRSLSASNSSSYSNGSGSRKNSRCSGKERDRSNSTKTLSSSLSSAGSFSNGYTNYGYDGSLDRSNTRRTYSNF